MLTRAARCSWISQAFKYSNDCTGSRKGLVLGAYEGCEPGELILTPSAEQFDDKVKGKLKELLKGSTLRKKKAFVFGNLSEDFSDVAIAGLGPEGVGYNKSEDLNECKENIRIAAGVGARALQEKGVKSICVEEFTNSDSAAEGAYLGTFRYQDLKGKQELLVPSLELFDGDKSGWQYGSLKGQAQNLARKITQTPANLMTPSIFAQYAVEVLCPCGVQVEARCRDWINSEKLFTILTVAKGSCEPPIFLELLYCGLPREVRPIVLAGKGITYDSGGLDLKRRAGQTCKEMMEWRADMAGAAVILSVFYAAAKMSLPINLVGLIPLCENAISGMAMKPGDVVKALNGKTIAIEDTDNEGRVVMADTLIYSEKYKPCMIVHLGDYTTGLNLGIGDLISGLYTNTDTLWEIMKRVGAETGERFWRLPLWKHYRKQIANYQEFDVSNLGYGKGGTPNKGAAFLAEFMPPVDFIHIDISGTGLKSHTNLIPYLKKGYMTGRPARALVEFLYGLACPHTKTGDC